MTQKSAMRLRAKLLWLAGNNRNPRVIYLCGTDAVRKAVARAAAEVAPRLDLHVLQLPAELHATATSASRSSADVPDTDVRWLDLICRGLIDQ